MMGRKMSGLASFFVIIFLFFSKRLQSLSKFLFEKCPLLVGTRSDMSCLENIFNNQSPDRYMEYKYYDFKYTQMTMSKIENDKIIKITSQKQSNNSLQIIMNYDNVQLRRKSMSKDFLGKMVKVKMDRPLGSKHPKYHK